LTYDSVKVPLLAIILLHELHLSRPIFAKKRFFAEAFFSYVPQTMVIPEFANHGAQGFLKVGRIE
jgi:hypothetical protein